MAWGSFAHRHQLFGDIGLPENIHKIYGYGSTTSRGSSADSGRPRCSARTGSSPCRLNADVAPGHALDEASNDVRAMLAGLGMPPTMSFRLQGQSKILDETTANLMMAIGLAMIFVYMVLASQFESFLQPIVIMLVLPIAVPFALFTLWATGRTLNLWSALGMLLLLGIVKKNSILQVDYANVLRARGVPLREAIVESCRTRLRPILMTTTAIIAGLIPTSLGIGIGGTGRAAIAVTIIGGQSLCLFLTLLLVPVAYVKFDALERALVGDGAGGGSAASRRAPSAVCARRATRRESAVRGSRFAGSRVRGRGDSKGGSSRLQAAGCLCVARDPRTANPRPRTTDCGLRIAELRQPEIQSGGLRDAHDSRLRS